MPDHEQVEARVIESLEEVFDRAVCLERELEPRKTIAGARRAGSEARQGFLQRAFPVVDTDLRDRAERDLLYLLEAHRTRHDSRQ